MVITANPPKFDKRQPSKGGYDAIVYIDGSQVIAEDSNGRKICPPGVAGTDDYTVLSSAINLHDNTFISSGVFSIYDELLISRDNVSVHGNPGYGTCIRQMTDGKSIFRLQGSSHLEGIQLQDLHLGTTGNTSNCIYARLSHRGVFRNILSSGWGAYGIYLDGCLMNVIDSPIFTANLPLFIPGLSTTRDGGIRFERIAGICASQCNTIINPVIEGCKIGVYISDHNYVEGSNKIIGGTIEGCTTSGIEAYNSVGINIDSVWMEGSANKILFDNVKYSQITNAYSSLINLVSCDGIDILGGEHTKQIYIDSNSKNCKVSRLRYDKNIVNCSDSSICEHLTKGFAGSFNVGIYHSTPRDVFSNPAIVFGSSLPMNMTNYGSSIITKCGVGEADTTKKIGTHSAKIEKTTSGSWQGLLTDALNVVAGDIVTIVAWIKVVNGGGSVDAAVCFFYNNGSGIETYNHIPYITSGEWQKIELVYTVLPGYTSHKVFVGPDIAGASGAACYLGGLNVYCTSHGRFHASGSSTGTGSEQTIAHGLAAIPTGCKAWITYLVGTRYVTEMIPFDATNVYPTVATGTAYNWRIE